MDMCCYLCRWHLDDKRIPFKNATFSIRNYFNKALLYYKHLCQRGRDTITKEKLYRGNAKGAEGYAAKCTFGEAKKEGIGIEVHWQDADSSSSNAVRDHFPAAKVMICGGHAGRAHKKQLEKLAKLRSFSEDFKRKREKFPTVNEVACCPNRHFPGCGCMSAFIAQARNNFSSEYCLRQIQQKRVSKACTRVDQVVSHGSSFIEFNFICKRMQRAGEH